MWLELLSTTTTTEDATKILQISHKKLKEGLYKYIGFLNTLKALWYTKQNETKFFKPCGFEILKHFGFVNNLKASYNVSKQTKRYIYLISVYNSVSFL